MVKNHSVGRQPLSSLPYMPHQQGVADQSTMGAWHPSLPLLPLVPFLLHITSHCQPSRQPTYHIHNISNFSCPYNMAGHPGGQHPRFCTCHCWAHTPRCADAACAPCHSCGTGSAAGTPSCRRSSLACRPVITDATLAWRRQAAVWRRPS